MAWGYWNATPAADRGRSPRKNKEFSQDNHNQHASQLRHTQPPPVVEPVEEIPCLPQESSSSVIMPNHSNIHLSEVEFETEHQTLSRYTLCINDQNSEIVLSLKLEVTSIRGF